MPTTDMSRPSAERKVSHKYLEYLNEWGRRLRKSAPAPQPRPRDAAITLEGYIHGVRVQRKGRSATPPAEDVQQQWASNGRRVVEGRSHSARPRLLDNVTPLTAKEARPLTADETRARYVRRVTQRFNQSSLVGAGALIKEEEVATPRRACRKTGEHNPGWGLKEHMTSTLSFSPEPSPPPSALASEWSLGPRPNTADSILRHRYDDPSTEAEPAPLAGRMETPARRVVDLEESRSEFMAQRSAYAANKAWALYGSARLRNPGSITARAARC